MFQTRASRSYGVISPKHFFRIQRGFYELDRQMLLRRG
jgi:hypothetical protein